ncbi:MAG: hypothetical protein OXE40_19240, partial [Gammaproteobacteria bacterium]|nr:hypothetical protein [Gammaproteobacteria bacterium]
EFTAANPLSSTPLTARFRQIWVDILLNRSAKGAATANFRFRDFLRRRLLGQLGDRRPGPANLLPPPQIEFGRFASQNGRLLG